MRGGGKPDVLRQQAAGTEKKRGLLLLMLGAVFVLAVIISLCVGSTMVTPAQIFSAVRNGNVQASAYRIFFYIRLPRTVAAAFSGAALAVSGVIIQAALNNVLAGPNIIGVNSGAGFFTLLTLALFPARPELILIGAFVGALICMLLIFCLCAYTGAGRLTVILAGVAIGSLFSAGIDSVSVLDPDLAVSASAFMIGGFSGITFSRLLPSVCLIFTGLLLIFPAGSTLNVLLLIFPAGSTLNVLLLGEESAKSLGMHVGVVRMLLLVVAAALAGAAVSFSGLLGFVGLLVPHMARRILGSDNRILLPAACLLGAGFVLICDVLSRILFAPFELPVGIILSALGAPFFLFLLLRMRRGDL